MGWIAVILFAVIYLAEFLPHHGGPPVTLRWIQQTVGTPGLIALNILIVLGFLALLPYRQPSRETWKSKGAFAAFVIALMTEMFGWPLVLMLLSPMVEVPSIAKPFHHWAGHWVAPAGTALSLLGVALIASGWSKIHGALGLVTDGPYRYLRHPQYTGIFLFTLGWMFHWPSVITLILWPILMGAYVWLSLQEERQVRQEFGPAYEEYASRTKRFVPFVF